MNMMTATPESLSEQTGLEILPMHVLIAKNSVAGLSQDDIAHILGVTAQEVQELEDSAEYRAARLLIATDYASQQVETDFSWDNIESTAVKSLVKRVQLERDTETLLRIAAIANKAQRRTPVSAKGVLDPARGGAQVKLTLTDRITQKLANGTTQTAERQISVLDGSAVNPKFEDIDALFGVTAAQRIPTGEMKILPSPDFDESDLTYGG